MKGKQHAKQTTEVHSLFVPKGTGKWAPGNSVQVEARQNRKARAMLWEVKYVVEGHKRQVQIFRCSDDVEAMRGIGRWFSDNFTRYTQGVEILSIRKMPEPNIVDLDRYEG